MICRRNSAALALVAVLLVAACAPVLAGKWGPGKCAKAAAKTARKGCAPPPPPQEWLAVQTALGCGFEATPGGGVALVLTGVAGTTTAFTDRPVRNATSVETALFDGAFSVEFGDDSPNGVLTGVPQEGGVQISVVVQLSAPKYRANRGTLTYMVQQSAAQEAVGAVAAGLQMESCSLFIDGLILCLINSSDAAEMALCNADELSNFSIANPSLDPDFDELVSLDELDNNDPVAADELVDFELDNNDPDELDELVNAELDNNAELDDKLVELNSTLDNNELYGNELYNNNCTTYGCIPDNTD